MSGARHPDRAASAAPCPRGRPKRAATEGEVSSADRLIDAALAAFATTGFEGASLRQIAGVVGVDVALITHHFGSKLGLWRAVIDASSRRLISAFGDLEQPSAQIAPVDRLTDVLGHFVDIVCDMPFVGPFVMLELVQQGARFEYFRERMVQPIHDALVPLIVASIGVEQAGAIEADYLFIAINGAIITSVAARPYLKTLTASAAHDESFRRELKRVIGGMVDPLASGAV